MEGPRLHLQGKQRNARERKVEALASCVLIIKNENLGLWANKQYFVAARYLLGGSFSYFTYRYSTKQRVSIRVLL